MRFPRNARTFRGQLDASPFVGVLFLVAIFLLLNSSLVFVPGVAIRLPEASDYPGVTNPTVYVAMDRNGRLYYESQVISEDSLLLKLREAVQRIKGPVTLVLYQDKAVTAEMIARLCKLTRDAGIKVVLQSVRPPTGPAGGQTGQ